MPRKQVPTGLPGEQAQALKRRAEIKARVQYGVLAVLGWVLLVVIVGPSRASMELPPLGPASRDLVAQRDFVDAEPVPDLTAQQERAAAQVPVHYTLDQLSARRRIDALHDAFRLVRPRWRLYLAERARLLGEPPPDSAPQTADKAFSRPLADKPTTPVRQAEVTQLDQAIGDEMAKLRPEFESLVAVRRGEMVEGAFDQLQRAGFAEEIELVLTDAAQVLLSERIVRDRERFEDDLTRGVIDAIPADAA